MNHARAARSAPFTPTRLLGSLLLGGALLFTFGHAAQAAGHSGHAGHAAHGGCEAGACPMHGGERGQSGAQPGRHQPGHGMMGEAGGDLPIAGPGFERLLDEVQATEAQRKQIRGIADKARADLRALREKATAQHHDAMAIWTSPKLDATEAEKQRQQMLAQHDQVSKRMMQAMLDVGQVLTPEQRAKAAASMKQRHERTQDRQERLRDHMLRRSAPAVASQPAPAR